MSNQVQKDLVSVAKIGKTIGVKGELLLHVLSDFPQSIQVGNVYFVSLAKKQMKDLKWSELVIQSYDKKRSIVKFFGIDSKESAKEITNLTLYDTKERTKENCFLKEGEYFWFDLMGARIIENGEFLGSVREIERFSHNDFLWIETSKELQQKKFPKYFFIPYTKRYILEVESANPKIIYTQFCKEILESS